MEKRMVMAIVMSLAILLAFQFIFPGRKARQQFPAESAVNKEVTGKTQEGPFAGGGERAFLTEKEAISEEESQPEEITNIETEKFGLTFSDIGGNLKKIVLHEYVEDKENQVLCDIRESADQIFNLDTKLAPGLSKRKFSQTRGADYLEYTTIQPDRIKVIKRYNFFKSLDYIEIETSIKNLTNQTITLFYKMEGPSCLESSKEVAGRSFLEAAAMIDGKVWKKSSVKGQEEKSGFISWVALKNRYFALALKPITPPMSVTFRQLAEKELATALNSQVYTIAPQEQITDKYILYAGPLDEQRIASVSTDMQAVVDYGFFGIVSKALLAILRFFHSIVKNWGLAIILLTITVNVVLFPLTFKSFSSMQKMKKIQPHIQKLRELHKDNSQRLNKEMMELYRKYNVNPLGGCLPMLLQMPIFIALYQGLMKSIELKGAHFLWIKNLAKPEAVPLPVTLPLIGNTINILPLLMVGMMALQQKFSQGTTMGAMTEEQAKQQKMMMLFMPLLFGFIFYNMPSGLVLYWLTNTILMTAEQGFIHKRTEN